MDLHGLNARFGKKASQPAWINPRLVSVDILETHISKLRNQFLFKLYQYKLQLENYLQNVLLKLIQP